MATAAGTIAATAGMPAMAHTESDGLELSVRDPLGEGFEAGADRLAEHWHLPPHAVEPPSEEQAQAPVPPQQFPAAVAFVDPFWQQERAALARAVQREQCAADALSGRVSACEPVAEGLPHPQAIEGNASTGTSTAASQTMIRVVRQSKKRKTRPRSIRPVWE